MYSDKDKLKLNIFNDFEKQESWQSYTTLLFADINTKNDIKTFTKNNGGKTSDTLNKEKNK